MPFLLSLMSVRDVALRGASVNRRHDARVDALTAPTGMD
jgi:hypothetical protein